LGVGLFLQQDHPLLHVQERAHVRRNMLHLHVVLLLHFRHLLQRAQAKLNGGAHFGCHGRLYPQDGT
jgi:hypothetical protein